MLDLERERGEGEREGERERDGLGSGRVAGMTGWMMDELVNSRCDPSTSDIYRVHVY